MPLAGSAQNVTIVYPMEGAAYRAMEPAPGEVDASYFTASFSVTCAGGPHLVEWGFGSEVIGSASFYEQMSTQQVWKLPRGRHRFWVNAGPDCGRERVKFWIDV